MIKPSEISEVTSLNKAVDVFDLGNSVMNDLETIFTAISDASEDKYKVKKLARLGKYLTDDWANLMDCASEDLKNLQKK